METSTEVELNQLLEELSEIKADDDDLAGDDSPPPPPPRDSLVFDSPMDEAARSSTRVSVQGGKISYYEEPSARSSDRFGNTGDERFSTRPSTSGAPLSKNSQLSKTSQAPSSGSYRSSDRFGATGDERFSTRPSSSGAPLSKTSQASGNDRFSDRGAEDDRFGDVQDDSNSGFVESDTYSAPASTSCKVCGKEIEGDALQALGALYHFSCFSCSNCRKNIGTEEFFDKDNKAYCLSCYKSSFLPTCSRCKKTIEGRYLKALNQDFHEQCFSCAVCNQAFSDGKFYEKDENPYCLQHYNELFGYTCAKCHQTITDGTAIAALDKYWHRNHFTCTKCNKAFADGKFFEDEGQPYCQEHYHQRRGTICGKCNKPIDGMCVSALEKKWHQGCFTCTKCNDVLSGQVMLSEGQVYCPKCANSL
jgi:paxillin